MPSIYLEQVPIEVFYLGYLGGTHLQLVFVPDSESSTPVPQDLWYVMEGTRIPTPDGAVLGVLGDSGVLTLSEANGLLIGDALVNEIGTPDSRGSRLVTAFDAQAIWDRMAGHAYDILDTAFRYTAVTTGFTAEATLNSSSFIASVMYGAGLDIMQHFPYNAGISPGYTTLLGTFGDDHLRIQAQFNALFGGPGQDEFRGINDVDRIDRMYGGADNDRFFWSHGLDIVHGGDSSMSYEQDGVDTINVEGIGQISIRLSPYRSPHVSPTHIIDHAEGQIMLFSIERIEWNDATDVIIVGPGIELIEDTTTLDLGGESDERGDELSFIDSSTGVIVNTATATAHHITASGGAAGGGMWVESLEWVTGSAHGDRIYAGGGIRGIEGGNGDDIIDARFVTAHSGASPLGYDVEIDAGEDDDTIVSGNGRTYAAGGEGSDRFILSGLTQGPQPLEFIIADADANDSLYVPYDLLNGTNGDYDGSQLMQILGGIGTFEDMQEFGYTQFFEHQTLDQLHFGGDQTNGVIEFVGYISFVLDGSDLVITVERGEAVTETIDLDDTGQTTTYVAVYGDPDTDAIIRVLDFQPGDLGINFIDPGIPYADDDGNSIYPNWNSAVDQLNGTMLDPLDPRPTSPTSDPNDPANAPPAPTPTRGGSGDDLISVNAPANVDAGDGDDQIIASGEGNDHIDGGVGADLMQGGGGNDEYAVDNAGDSVVEASAGGSDTVFANINYVLPNEVEHLVLGSGASDGGGNELDNRLVGNDAANTLTGNDGDDALTGLGGDDVLIGGAGSDTYVFVRGNGWDVIVDTGAGENEIDEIVLFDQIRPDDIGMYRLASTPDDLVLRFDGGGRITISGFFSSADAGIDRIVFDDATTWSRSMIEDLAAAAPVLTAPPPEAIDDADIVYGGVDFIVPAEMLLANDRAGLPGATLSIVAVANVSVGTASIDANGDIQLAPPADYEGALSFDYTITDGNGGTATASVTMTIVSNAAPVISGSLADASVTADQPFVIAIPSNLFSDGDGDALSLSVRLADGSPLPSWLHYDWYSRTLSGTAPVGFGGPLEIRLTASDGFMPVTSTFTIAVASANPGVTLNGGSGDDTLIGGSLDDMLNGNGGNDALRGAGGADTLDGGAGIDRVSYYDQTVSLVLNLDGTASSGGAAQGDRLISIENVTGGSGDDIINGNADANTLQGGLGNDTLRGGDGNDTLLGNAGADTLDGGNGIDRVSYYDQTADLVVTLDGSAAAGGDAQGDVLLSIEHVVGGSGSDTITGNAVANTLQGLAGNDTIAGAGGADILHGGDGDDTLRGDAGNDNLQGNAGNDTLEGGDGNDLLAGNAGADSIDGGAGLDRVSYYEQTAALTLYLDGTASSGGEAEGDVITNVEDAIGGTSDDTIHGNADANNLNGALGHDTLFGGEGNDTLQGSTGDDTLMGEAGADVLHGGDGADFLYGGSGDDAFRGGAGADYMDGGEGFQDRVTYYDQTANLVIRLDSMPVSGGDAEGDILVSVEHVTGGNGNDIIEGDAAANRLVGLGGDDTVRGGEGDDSLYGDIGDDTLDGETGNDTLFGGDGSDTFVFGAAFGHDTIADFSATGGDVVDLRSAGFANFADLMAHTTQSASGTDVTITVDGTQSVTLLNVSLFNLSQAADHILVT